MANRQFRRVATYERTSSEDQKERETIKTQEEQLALRLKSDPGLDLVERFIDDGVSGTIPMADRPAGRRLLEAADSKKFDELWTYGIKRLGREAVDLLMLRRRLESLGIRLISLLEGEQTGLSYDVHAIVADYDRRQFLRISADGMDRAARDGRYTGGVVAYGYEVQGRKGKARLVPSENIVWHDWSESDVIKHIYQRSAVDGWSNPEIAQELNDLGVPTHYAKDGREVLSTNR